MLYTTISRTKGVTGRSPFAPTVGPPHPTSTHPQTCRLLSSRGRQTWRCHIYTGRFLVNEDINLLDTLSVPSFFRLIIIHLSSFTMNRIGSGCLGVKVEWKDRWFCKKLEEFNRAIIFCHFFVHLAARDRNQFDI